MTQTRQYIECDCKKGKLEEIARTRPELSIQQEPGHSDREDRVQTIYYACDTCNQIFMRDRSELREDAQRLQTTFTIILNGQVKKYDNDPAKDIVPYTGTLTRKQIEKQAPLESGVWWGN